MKFRKWKSYKDFKDLYHLINWKLGTTKSSKIRGKKKRYQKGYQTNIVNSLSNGFFYGELMERGHKLLCLLDIILKIVYLMHIFLFLKYSFTFWFYFIFQFFLLVFSLRKSSNRSLYTEFYLFIYLNIRIQIHYKNCLKLYIIFLKFVKNKIKNMIYDL